MTEKDSDTPLAGPAACALDPRRSGVGTTHSPKPCPLPTLSAVRCPPPHRTDPFLPQIWGVTAATLLGSTITMYLLEGAWNEEDFGPLDDMLVYRIGRGACGALGNDGGAVAAAAWGLCDGYSKQPLARKFDE